MEKLQKLKLGLDDICAVTGECRSNVVRAVKQGHLRTFRVGRRVFARPREVERWVNWLEAQSDAGKPVSYQSRAAETPTHD